MKFLVVLIVFMLYRHYLGENLLRRFLPIKPLMQKSLRFGAIVGGLLCVVVPVLLSCGLLYFYTDVSSLFAWFFMSVLILLYGVDVFDSRKTFAEHREVLLKLPNSVTLTEVVACQEAFFSDTLERLFRAFIPAFFWFLCLGPIAALAYLLLRSFHDIISPDDAQRVILGKLIFFMEFIPVRLSALLFSLLGSFGPCFDLWLKSFADGDLSIGQYLARLAVAAGGQWDRSLGDDAAAFISLSEVQLTEILSLWQRTLYGWLGLAALVTIIGF